MSGVVPVHGGDPHRPAAGDHSEVGDQPGFWRRTQTVSAGLPRCGNRRRPVRSVATRDGNSITEIVYRPTGPDIPGELERFITIARDV